MYPPKYKSARTCNYRRAWQNTGITGCIPTRGASMGDFSQESLVAAAGVDPWKLQAQFAAGDPEEIYAMAKGFQQAAAQQGESVTLASKGLETAGDGYKVNNATPIDVNTQVAEAKKSLGG